MPSRQYAEVILPHGKAGTHAPKKRAGGFKAGRLRPKFAGMDKIKQDGALEFQMMESPRRMTFPAWPGGVEVLTAKR
jgi:hypothetical protein